MTRIFRALMAATLLLYLAWTSSFYFPFALFEPHIADAVVHTGTESLIDLPEILFFLLAALWLIATIGIWRFSTVGRTFFLLLTVVELILVGLSGLLIQSAIQALTSDLIAIGRGSLLTMAYFTSLDGRFRDSPRRLG